MTGMNDLFGLVLGLGSILLILGWLGSAPAPTTAKPERSPGLPVQPDSQIEQECLRLQAQLKQQLHLMEDLQRTTFEQLQTLLTSYPTVRRLVQVKSDLPAANLVNLFTPLDNWLHSLGYEAIGSPWESVAYNPQLHQPDQSDIAPGEPVYIRFVGYRQGATILCPAKVSRTLPSIGL